MILPRESAPPLPSAWPARSCQLAELPETGRTAVELGDPPHPLPTGELADDVDAAAVGVRDAKAVKTMIKWHEMR